MTENNVHKWYVVRAISGQENKVKNYIETEINKAGYSDYLSKVLVPTETVVYQRNGKRISKERNFYPGYIMVEANLAGEVSHIIKSVAGVIGFLGETRNGDPLPLRPSEVNKLLGKVDELSANPQMDSIQYEVDEVVKMVDGPFSGFNGTVVSVNKDKGKVELEVSMFGRMTKVELSYTQIEKL